MNDKKQKIFLTSTHITILENFSTKLSLDKDTIQQTKSNYNKFLQIYSSKKDLTSGDKKLFLIAAIFITSRFQQLINLQGEDHTRGNGVSISQIIQNLDQDYPIDNFLEKVVTFANNQSYLKSQHHKLVKKIVDQAQQTYNIYKKYQQIMKSLQIQQQNDDDNDDNLDQEKENQQEIKDIGIQYIHDFQNLIWILYLDNKQEIYQHKEDTEIIKNISVLINTILFGILNLPKSIKSQTISEQIKELDFNSYDERQKFKVQIRNIIKENIDRQDTLEVSTLDYYEKKVVSKVNNSIQQLRKRKSVDLSSTSDDQYQENLTGTQLFFQPSHIKLKMNWFQKWYQKGFNENEEIDEEDSDGDPLPEPFDETCFLITKPITPSKYDKQHENENNSHNINQSNNNVNTDKDTFSSEKSKQFSSHRVLQFAEDNMQDNGLNRNLQETLNPQQDPSGTNSNKNSVNKQLKQLNSGNNSSNNNQIQQPKNKSNKGTPFQIKTTYASPQIQKSPFFQNDPSATPVQSSLANYQWLNILSKSDQTKKLDDYLALINPNFKQIIIDKLKEINRNYLNAKQTQNNNNNNQNNKMEKEDQIEKTILFYCNVLEKLIVSEEKKVNDSTIKRQIIITLLDNKDFIYSLFAMCILTKEFIQSTKKNAKLQLNELLQACEIKTIDLWRVISNFALFDKQMPMGIKEHLFNIERNILLYSICEEKDYSIVLMMKQFFSPEEYIKLKKYKNIQYDENPPYYKILCKRIFIHSALRVFEICAELDLSPSLQERIWSVIKYIFEKESELFQYAYIDQIIISSIYIRFMQNKKDFPIHDLTFKKLMEKYEKLPFFESSKIRNYIHENDRIDLIQFYNKIYLPKVKQYVKSDPSAIENVLRKKEQILNSPLSNSIPKQFYMFSPICRSKTPMASPYPQTPLTKQLYAIGEILESPQPEKKQQVDQNNNNNKQGRQQLQRSSRKLQFDEKDDIEKIQKKQKISNEQEKSLDQPIKPFDESVQNKSPKFGGMSGSQKSNNSNANNQFNFSANMSFNIQNSNTNPNNTNSEHQSSQRQQSQIISFNNISGFNISSQLKQNKYIDESDKTEGEK